LLLVNKIGEAYSNDCQRVRVWLVAVSTKIAKRNSVNEIR